MYIYIYLYLYLYRYLNLYLCLHLYLYLYRYLYLYLYLHLYRYIYVSRFCIPIPRRLPRIVRLYPSPSTCFARFSSPPVSHICGPHVSLHPMMIPFYIPPPPPRNLPPNDKPSFSSRQSHTHPPRSRSRSKPDSLVKKAHHPSYRRSTIYHIPPFVRSPAFLQLPGIPPRLFFCPSKLFIH